MATEIRALLDAHEDVVREAGKGLLDGNTAKVAQSLAGLAVGLATASPVLGVLGSEAVGRVFANTATARLKKAVAEAETAEQRDTFIRDLSAPIEALLGEFLIQIVRVQHRVKDELLEGLRGGPELVDFGSAAAIQLQQVALQIEQIDVSGGGLGVEVSPAGRNAFVKKISVTGAGSVGVKI